MKHNLPVLPYGYTALEPYIDQKTMEIHHTKHHQAYVDNLNKALKDNANLAELSVEKLLADTSLIPEDIRQAVVNNGGGHANHSFFWQILRPSEKAGKPMARVSSTIEAVYGNFETFKANFTDKAMSVFGSGWAFLIVNAKGELELTRQSFQNSPLSDGNTPILGIDVWEHAYYLKYQNRRAEYVEAWWNVVNWQQVEENYLKLVKS